MRDAGGCLGGDMVERYVIFGSGEVNGVGLAGKREVWPGTVDVSLEISVASPASLLVSESPALEVMSWKSWSSSSRVASLDLRIDRSCEGTSSASKNSCEDTESIDMREAAGASRFGLIGMRRAFDSCRRAEKSFTTLSRSRRRARHRS